MVYTHAKLICAVLSSPVLAHGFLKESRLTASSVQRNRRVRAPEEDAWHLLGAPRTTVRDPVEDSATARTRSDEVKYPQGRVEVIGMKTKVQKEDHLFGQLWQR